MLTGWKSRKIAIEILEAYERNGNFRENIEEKTKFLPLRDRAFIREIVAGSVRYLRLLDFYIERTSGKSQKKQPSCVRNALRVLLYQILFTGVPDYAAVNETVEAVKRLCGKARAGFVNAVAKKLKSFNCERAISSIDNYFERISIRYSFETWMVRRWARFYPGEIELLLSSLNRVAPLYLRVNRIKVTMGELKNMLTKAGIEIEEHPAFKEDMLRVKGRVEIKELPGFKEGYFYIQDPASFLAAYLLSAKKGERILDVGAAPGGKTTAIASLTNNSASIVAVDISPERMELLRKNCRRLGVENVKFIVTDISRDREFRNRYRGYFDRILIDAPCSATGVIRRHPEGKWNKSISLIKHNQKIQRKLLKAAKELLKEDGLLLYSVCSLEREEGEENVKYALSLDYNPGKFDKLPFIKPEAKKGHFRVFPHKDDMDGFFYAVFKG